MLLEKIVNCSGGPHLQNVTLTVEIDPQVRNMFAYFGIPDVALFQEFDWGRTPEILEKGWLRQGLDYGWSGGGQFAQDKELVVVVRGGSKFRCERVEEALRQGAFRMFDEKAKLLVRFDGEGSCRCCFHSGV